MIVVDASYEAIFRMLTTFGIAVEDRDSRNSLANQLAGADIPDVSGVDPTRVPLSDLREYLDYWIGHKGHDTHARRRMAAAKLWKGTWHQLVEDVREADRGARALGHSPLGRDLEPGAADRHRDTEAMRALLSDPDVLLDRHRRMVFALVRRDGKPVEVAAAEIGRSVSETQRLLEEVEAEVEADRPKAEEHAK